jgi:hypothetical protein
LGKRHLIPRLLKWLMYVIRFSCPTDLSRRSSKSEVGSSQRRLIIMDQDLSLLL